MQNTLSEASQRSFNALMFKWFALSASVLVYLLIAYVLLMTEAYTPPFSVDILQKMLFSGMSIHSALYLVAAILFVGTDMHSKHAYKKLLLAASEQKFKTKEAEFDFFKTQYASLMFLHITLFKVIAILGILLFVLTFDITTMANLVIIALLGFVLLMPTKAKLTFPEANACPLKK